MERATCPWKPASALQTANPGNPPPAEGLRDIPSKDIIARSIAFRTRPAENQSGLLRAEARINPAPRPGPRNSIAVHRAIEAPRPDSIGPRSAGPPDQSGMDWGSLEINQGPSGFPGRPHLPISLPSHQLLRYFVSRFFTLDLCFTYIPMK